MGNSVEVTDATFESDVLNSRDASSGGLLGRVVWSLQDDCTHSG